MFGFGTAHGRAKGVLQRRPLRADAVRRGGLRRGRLEGRRPTRSAEAACDAAAWKAGDDAAPRETSTRPDGAPLLSERVVERTRAHTAVVNDRLADERQRRETDDAAMDKLSQLADMYASHNVNRSMGAKPGVDAAAIDGGEVDSDEWGDSD